MEYLLRQFYEHSQHTVRRAQNYSVINKELLAKTKAPAKTANYILEKQGIHQVNGFASLIKKAP